MEIKFRGTMTIADLVQAVYEQLHLIKDEHAVRYSRGATLYINPSNEFGDDVVPRSTTGQEVRKVHCAGPYRSAADDYKI